MYEQNRSEPQLFGLYQPQQHSTDELETTLFDNAYESYVDGAILIKYIDLRMKKYDFATCK